MIQYQGTNPPTISTTYGAGAPGVVVNYGAYGVFGYPLSAQGGDLRGNANLMAIGQANRNCINWLAYRTLDWISGGTYTSTALVALSNGITFNGTLNFYGNSGFGPASNLFLEGMAYVTGGGSAGTASTLQIGNVALGVGHLDVIAGSDITIEADAFIYVTGTSGHLAHVFVGAYGLIELGNGAALTMDPGSTTTQEGEYIKSGSSAITVDRITTADPQGAGGTLTLADPRAEDVYSIVSGGIIILGFSGSWPLGTKVRFYIAQGQVLAGAGVDFYQGSTSTKIVRMNPGAATPLSAGYACYFLDFVVTSVGWQACACAGGIFQSF